MKRAAAPWLALVVAALGSCSNQVDSQRNPGDSTEVRVCSSRSCGATLDECPASPPEEGSPCEQAWEVCSYYEPGAPCPTGTWRCGSTWTTYALNSEPCPVAGGVCRFGECLAQRTTCGDDGRWSFDAGCDTTECQQCCDAAACPDARPEPGSACLIPDFCEPAECPYFDVETPCGPQPTTTICWENEWQLPTQCGCYDFTTPAACSFDSLAECYWLEPGCAEPALAAAGCFPVEACTQAACPPGRSCLSTSVLFCSEDEGCDDCSLPWDKCQ